jgi:two-component system, cell cycle sensor histidine kinase and response regulator CckA
MSDRSGPSDAWASDFGGIVEASRTIVSARGRDRLIESIVTAARITAGVERSALVLERAGELHTLAIQNLEVRRVEAVVRATLTRGAPTNDGELVCLPLIHAETRAALLLGRSTPGWFTGTLETTLELLAMQAATALAHVELAERCARRREREDQLRAIIENTNTVVFLKDLEGRYTLVNRQLELDTGLTREQMLGKTDLELFSRETALRLRADDLRVIESGEATSFEGVTEFPDGPRVFLSTKFPLRDADGEIYAICGVATDITERKRAEEQLRHVQRMNAIGQLAGGIAHDFNNMLAGILASAELLDMQLPRERDPPVNEALATIIDACERASKLTRELLAFSHQGHRRVESVDLHALIHATVGLLHRGIDRRVEVELRLAAVECVVTGDPAHLQSALLNLGVNARDAMPEGGRLTIATRNVEFDAEACAASPYALQPGRFVELEVRDTGLGIDDHDQLRIFEPFFTTKEIGRGTGLGLAAVHGTVVEHGGAITVSSAVGVGTRFVIQLPSASVAARPSRRDDGDATVGEGRILLVDDEDVVRKTGAKLLESLGYEVVTASNGREGVELFTTHHAGLDLVLLDMVMPEMNGHDAFLAMHRIDAEVPVVVCSGYAADQSVRSLEGEGLAGFLAKPYRRVELAKIVAAARRR